MASSLAMKLSFILLLTLFSAMKTQARDSQFFNKVSSTVVPNQEQPAAATTTAVAPNKEQPETDNQQQEPDFLPENAKGYGLYSHESGKLSPSTTVPTTTTASEEPLYKHLPKNYNPVAYVTEPENIDDTDSFTENTYTDNEINENDENDEAQNYNNNQVQKEYQAGQPEDRRFTSNTLTAKNRDNINNFNYNGGTQESLDTRFDGQQEDNFYNGYEENNSFRPQGLSDTRSLENGKYFYDVNNERYGENHPYESSKGSQSRNEYNGKNYYGNNYQNNQYEFPDEQNLP